jgi:hypothetical protein
LTTKLFKSVPRLVFAGFTAERRIDMKRVVFLALVVLSISSVAFGQAGYIGLYSDPGGTTCTLNDFPGLCFVYVIHKATPGATASQYLVVDQGLGATFFLSDVYGPGILNIGTSHTGVAMAYGGCRPSDILLITMQYFCQGTAIPCATTRVIADPASATGTIEVNDCSLPIPNRLVGGGSVLTWNDTGSCDPPCGPVLPGPDSSLVTVTTDPPGLEVTVDAVPYTAPQQFLLEEGAAHDIGVTSPQSSGGTTYAFVRWNDDGAQTHQIVVPSIDTTYSAQFLPAHEVTVTTDPPGLEVTVDAVPYTAPRQFFGIEDSMHTIGATSPQQSGDTTFVFSHWSDGGAISHEITVLQVDTTFTAHFATFVPSPTIDSIVDVPNDQGGWVYLYFTRSVFDVASEDSIPISAYNIHRRVDDLALVASVLEDGKGITHEQEVYLPTLGRLSLYVPSGVGSRLLGFGERYYLVSGANSVSPPGVWSVVGTVFAQQQDQYIALVPTVGDSSVTIPHSVYYISAHTTTPSIFFDSAPDSGYSVDNIAPGVPQGVAVAYNTGSGNQLSWDPAPEPDFQYYRVYRGSDEDFTPGPGNLVHETATTGWTDPDYDGWGVHYKTTAVDDAGNESDPGSPGTVTAITKPVLPTTFALYQNVPNPFNPTTTIGYDVPAGGGVVTLRIYDVNGKLVRTLVDGPQTAGQKAATWNGRDYRGRGVASGIYFYRLRAPGYEKTLKMLLLQ